MISHQIAILKMDPRTGIDPTAETRVPDVQIAASRLLWSRALMAVLLSVLAVLVAWLGVELVRSIHQRSLVREIWGLGGYVRRLQRAPVGSGQPSWHRALFGADFLNPAVVVHLGGTGASDDDLLVVGKLKGQRGLDLRDTLISDAGLRHLRGLRDLRLLRLGGTAITDAGLAHLRDLDRLEVLFLGETRITDAGLEQLSLMPNLRWLDLGKTAVTDEGVEQLKMHPHLALLDLSGTRITDAALIHIQAMRQLEVLIVDDCAVSDSGMSQLRAAAPEVRVFDENNLHPYHEITYW